MVHLILLVDETEVGERDQRWQIGVIEHHRGTLSVDFISKNAFSFMPNNSILVYALFDAFCSCLHSFAQYPRLPLEH